MSVIHKYRLSIISAVLLFIISVIPSNSLPKSNIANIDLLVHFCSYSILSFLILLAIKKENLNIHFLEFAICVLISGGYGMILELIQPIVSDRASEFSDFLANFIGASFGAGLMFIYYKPKTI